MGSLKQWLTKLLPPSSSKKLDLIDEAGDESFPASDPPSWAGSESNKTAAVKTQNFQDPVTILKEEHHVIMKAIYILHEQVERLEHHKPAQAAVLGNIIQFMREFVEKNHHEKEGDLLLQAMVSCGAPVQECPLTLLEQDHETSLALLTNLEKMLPDYEKNETFVRDSLIQTLNELKDIYTRHTLKEENYIFPMAEKYLTPSAQKSLFAAFNEIDQRH